MKEKKQIDKTNMSAREWMKTPQGKKEAAERASAMLAPLLKSLEEPQRRLYEALNPKQMAHIRFVSPSVHLDESSIHAIRGEVKNSKVEKAFLEYDGTNFYTRGKLIDFPESKAIYVLIIKALFEEADAEGFLSYDDINKYLERHGESHLIDEAAKRRRIANAFATLQRRRSRQKTQFPLRLPNGSPVIRIAHGRGFIITKS